jgi:hypothetical protein
MVSTVAVFAGRRGDGDELRGAKGDGDGDGWGVGGEGARECFGRRVEEAVVSVGFAPEEYGTRNGRAFGGGAGFEETLPPANPVSQQ